jgi:hypothetical protein
MNRPGGHLTLFGSVANLITVAAAAAEGYTVTFWQHLRFGLPLTLITLAITYLWWPKTTYRYRSRTWLKLIAKAPVPERLK